MIIFNCILFLIVLNFHTSIKVAYSPCWTVGHYFVQIKLRFVFKLNHNIPLLKCIMWSVYTYLNDYTCCQRETWLCPFYCQCTMSQLRKIFRASSLRWQGNIIFDPITLFSKANPSYKSLENRRVNQSSRKVGTTYTSNNNIRKIHEQ